MLFSIQQDQHMEFHSQEKSYKFKKKGLRQVPTDFKIFNKDYILPLLETCVTSMANSVFFSTGQRAPLGGNNNTVTCHRNTKWQN